MFDDIKGHLRFLYGPEVAAETFPRLVDLIMAYSHVQPEPRAEDGYFDERDAILITYGDMVQAADQAPLATLADFLAQTVGGAIDTIHLLPFFPYSSDDGFSIIDYKAVDPRLGTWADVGDFKHSFRLMFDAVVNHVSAQSAWFKGFRRGERPYDAYFITVPPGTPLQDVFRPRALPLLTTVETSAGPQDVWTTFSADQIDLNFRNPEVLLAIIDVLLFYVEKGASYIRLDAIAFLWKEVGTTCLHLPQTHRIIQLLRSVLDLAATHVVLITETNVPHQENVSYFGDGRNEAQMVYNFSLPPLTLDAFHRQNATILSRWAGTLTTPSAATGFFNFLASHDGIGLTPARGLLPDQAVTAMAQRVEALGGYVSYRSNPDGSESPYEMNISYLNALGDPQQVESKRKQARRFLAAQAIMLALRGVPGLYFHSLFGSQNWSEGVVETGQKRSINRQKLGRSELESALADPASLRSLIFFPTLHMLRVRRNEPAFHPQGEQEVLDLHECVFALWRRSRDAERHVLCLHNVSARAAAVAVPIDGSAAAGLRVFRDLIGGELFEVDGRELRLVLPPFGVMWLSARAQLPENDFSPIAA